MTAGILGRSRALLAIALLASLVFQSACSDKTLAAIAKYMPVVATANQSMLNTVINAQAAGTITVEEARPLVELNLKIAQAGKQVDAAIGGLATLNATQKASVLADIQPIMQAVTAEVATLNIGNPTTKTAVLASLTTLQTALAALSVAIG